MPPKWIHGCLILIVCSISEFPGVLGTLLHLQHTRRPEYKVSLGISTYLHIYISTGTTWTRAPATSRSRRPPSSATSTPASTLSFTPSSTRSSEKLLRKFWGFNVRNCTIVYYASFVEYIYCLLFILKYQYLVRPLWCWSFYQFSPRLCLDNEDGWGETFIRSR